MNMKLGFIGCGNMAGAMMGGIIKNEIFKPDEIIGADISVPGRESVKKKYGIHVTDSNKEVVENAEVVVFSIKPQYYQEVIEEVRNLVKPGQIMLTIAPGKTLEWLGKEFGKDVKIVRTMPNTPAMAGEGMTAVCPNENVTREELEYICRILESFGKAEIINENLMDVVVGVSGSSPAYVFMFIESMADAAVAGGMPRKQAYHFAAQAVLGSAKMVLETGKHPGELKDMVCSPGGTTIEAVRVLEQKGLRSAVFEAVGACVNAARTI
ncbi:MAG: pyrroline-5-carboxylate reductase [Coprococcus sp.]|nr:pyrroline-5-carboxylate reductase [Coprococcus sp.]